MSKRGKRYLITIFALWEGLRLPAMYMRLQDGQLKALQYGKAGPELTLITPLPVASISNGIPGRETLPSPRIHGM